MPNLETIALEMSTLSTATISDALFRMGHKDRTMRASIKPIDPGMRLYGPALPVKAYPGGTHACELAIEAVQPGQVIVIDGGAFLDAVLWGEIFSWMAKVKRAAGTVIDGAVRDIDDVIAIEYPLFAAGIVPAAGTGDRLGEVNIPICCAGVVVHPGDWVFGDRLGVVVVPPAKLAETRQRCDEVIAKETAMLSDLRAQYKGQA